MNLQISARRVPQILRVENNMVYKKAQSAPRHKPHHKSDRLEFAENTNHAEVS